MALIGFLWTIARGQTLSTTVLVGLAVLLMFMACFLAWKDKHEELEREHEALTALQERLKSPELTGEITQCIFRKIGTRLELFLGGYIANPTGPPSALVKWKIELISPVLHVYGNIQPPPQNDINLEFPEGTMHFPSQNQWVIRAGSPVPQVE